MYTLKNKGSKGGLCSDAKVHSGFPNKPFIEQFLKEPFQ